MNRLQTFLVVFPVIVGFSLIRLATGSSIDTVSTFAATATGAVVGVLLSEREKNERL